MKKLLLLFVSFHFTLLIISQTIRVPEDYPTIQQAIDTAVVQGDTVLVAAGTYYENLVIEDKSLVLTSYYLLTHDSSYIAQTIIDGGNLGGSVITVINTGDSSVLICGFTLQNGTGHIVENFSYGGGLYCEYSNLELNNLKVCNNYAGNAGGGIICFHSDLYIDSIEVCNNNCEYGGGIVLSKVNAIIKNSTISNNSTEERGGGIYIIGDDIVSYYVNIYNVEVSNNTSNSNGGGIYCMYQSNVYLTDSKIINNYAEEYGGGVFVDMQSELYVQNDLISENVAVLGGGIYTKDSDIDILNSVFTYNEANSGGGLYIWGVYSDAIRIVNSSIVNNYTDYYYGGIRIIYANVYLTNSIIWDNDSIQLSFESAWFSDDTLFVSNTGLMGGEDEIINDAGVISWLEGNIDQDPLFVGSGDHPYQIDYYSPCINAGTTDTTGLNLPEFDLAGKVRIFNNRVDMGAYEWNTTVGINELISQTSILKIQTYPNPVITSTTFEYTLEHSSTVQITIYNHLGKQVNLIQQNQSSGKQQVVWNAEGLHSGVYYFRLQAGDKVASGKMVLVR